MSQSPAAERMRRARERRREGYRSVLVDVHNQDIEALIRLGLLQQGNREDRTAIGDAVTAYLEGALAVPR